MIIFNGDTLEDHTNITIHNRGFNYGDAVFETIKSVRGKLLFWEDHYFRLMASMRIMRMEIPMDFTMEYLEKQIRKCLEYNELINLNARIKLIVTRKEGGLYTPENNDVDYLISASKIDNDFYKLNSANYRVDLFKDHYISSSLLSTIKTNNKAVNVVGSIYAKENDLNNCLLLNSNKNVIEALNGNLFLVSKNTIKTPPISDGCLNGIIRKQLLEIIKNNPDYVLEQTSISPFELQKADELFITNVIVGLQPITNYRKKSFETKVSAFLIEKLNEKVKVF